MLIVVLNDRYFLRQNDLPHPFGVTGFSTALINELEAKGLIAGIILYSHKNGLAESHFETVHRAQCPCIRYHFDFNHDPLHLSKVLESCIVELQKHSKQMRSVVYLQTPTLVPYIPPGQPFLVTHHGPFASEVIKLFGRPFAEAAFGGSSKKLNHLLKTQRDGIQVLINREDGFAIEISNVQANALKNLGMPADRIQVCLPPIEVPVFPPPPDSNGSGAIHLITAAARVDRFKGLTTFIDAVNLLGSQCHDLHVHLYAGGPIDTLQRNGLRERLTTSVLAHARILESLPRNDLLTFLGSHRHDGIFVFTSEYETFGITPYEAVLTGVTTVVPNNLSNIGMAANIPEAYRYSGGALGLSRKLEEFIQRKTLAQTGALEQQFLRNLIRNHTFIECLTETAARLIETTP